MPEETNDLAYYGMFLTDDPHRFISLIRCRSCGASFSIRNEDPERIRKENLVMDENVLSWFNSLTICCGKADFVWLVTLCIGLFG